MYLAIPYIGSTTQGRKRSHNVHASIITDDVMHHNGVTGPGYGWIKILYSAQKSSYDIVDVLILVLA